MSSTVIGWNILHNKITRNVAPNWLYMTQILYSFNTVRKKQVELSQKDVSNNISSIDSIDFKFFGYN